MLKGYASVPCSNDHVSILMFWMGFKHNMMWKADVILERDDISNVA